MRPDDDSIEVSHVHREIGEINLSHMYYLRATQIAKRQVGLHDGLTEIGADLPHGKRNETESQQRCASFY
jgi:hypothetical protein